MQVETWSGHGPRGVGPTRRTTPGNCPTPGRTRPAVARLQSRPARRRSDVHDQLGNVTAAGLGRPISSVATTADGATTCGVDREVPRGTRQVGPNGRPTRGPTSRTRSGSSAPGAVGAFRTRNASSSRAGRSGSLNWSPTRSPTTIGCGGWLPTASCVSRPAGPGWPTGTASWTGARGWAWAEWTSAGSASGSS